MRTGPSHGPKSSRPHARRRDAILSAESESAIRHLAAEAYNFLSSISVGHEDHEQVLVRLSHLQGIERLNNALLADGALGAVHESGVYFELPSGGGWRVNFRSLGTTALLKEWEQNALEQRPNSGLEQFASGVRERVLEFFRTAQSGATTVQQWVALPGVQLAPEVQRIEMPMGTIRVIRDPIPGLLVDRSSGGVYYLSGSHPARLRVERSGGTPNGPEIRSIEHDLAADLALVRIAFFYAAHTRLSFGLAQWRFPFDSVHGDAATAASHNPPIGVALVDAEQAARLEEISATLRAGYHASLAVAYTRLASAVLDRSDSVDQLIDAVVAWECMFGTEGETVFRVTGAMARLLEPNAGLRAELWRDLKSIYTARSKLVHGSTTPVVNPRAMAERSIDYTFRALLAMANMSSSFRAAKSGDRAAQLMVGSD